MFITIKNRKLAPLRPDHYCDKHNISLRVVRYHEIGFINFNILCFFENTYKFEIDNAITGAYYVLLTMIWRHTDSMRIENRFRNQDYISAKNTQYLLLTQKLKLNFYVFMLVLSGTKIWKHLFKNKFSGFYHMWKGIRIVTSRPLRKKSVYPKYRQNKRTQNGKNKAAKV